MFTLKGVGKGSKADTLANFGTKVAGCVNNFEINFYPGAAEILNF